MLDALLRRTHWLKDQNMRLCLHQVGRGAWLTETELQRDVERRRPEEAAKIAEQLLSPSWQTTLQHQVLEREARALITG